MEKTDSTNGLSFIPLGVGDAFSALYYSSCLAVGSGGRWVLVDCPHPIRKILREASATAGVSLDAPDFDAVVLTHLHADHCSGLEGLGFFSYFVLRRRLKILAHPRVLEHLWSGHLSAGMGQLLHAEGLRRHHFEDFFEPIPLSTTQPTDFGPFRIECRFTRHHIPTTALRIAGGGRSLGYSADTSFDTRLIDWLAEADLMIHETNYGTHTPYAPLAALPSALQARMRLIHYPDDFDLDASAIAPVRQGQRYAV